MMEKPYLKVKLVRAGAKLPSKREEDAGFDLYGFFETDFLILNPGDINMTPTGIKTQFSKDWVFYVAERGSTGSKGIARRCGVVDSGYRGELFVPLNNTSNKKIIFAKYEDEKLDIFLSQNKLEKSKVIIYPQSKAIAQAILFYAPHIEVEQVEELDVNSQRGAGALGSSGK